MYGNITCTPFDMQSFSMSTFIDEQRIFVLMPFGS